jgi:hypothetical protein
MTTAPGPTGAIGPDISARRCHAGFTGAGRVLDPPLPDGVRGPIQGTGTTVRP